LDYKATLITTADCFDFKTLYNADFKPLVLIHVWEHVAYHRFGVHLSCKTGNEGSPPHCQFSWWHHEIILSSQKIFKNKFYL
jgi:hypothetical protein